MEKKKILVIIGIILLVIYFQVGEKSSKKTACVAPANAEVIFRTSVSGAFGNFVAPIDLRNITWIALRYDKRTNTETNYLASYRYYAIHASTCGFNLSNSFDTILPYVLPNGARAVYRVSDTQPLIYIFEPAGCPTGKYTKSLYNYSDTITAELSASPTEPYTSNCQEVYETSTSAPLNFYPSFLTSKRDYLNGGLFADFIIKANTWIAS